MVRTAELASSAGGCSRECRKRSVAAPCLRMPLRAAAAVVCSLFAGIRSFSPDNQNVIEFYKPLTLIVGHNGAGKTVRHGRAPACCVCISHLPTREVQAWGCCRLGAVASLGLRLAL